MRGLGAVSSALSHTIVVGLDGSHPSQSCSVCMHLPSACMLYTLIHIYMQQLTVAAGRWKGGMTLTSDTIRLSNHQYECKKLYVPLDVTVATDVSCRVEERVESVTCEV